MVNRCLPESAKFRSSNEKKDRRVVKSQEGMVVIPLPPPEVLMIEAKMRDEDTLRQGEAGTLWSLSTSI